MEILRTRKLYAILAAVVLVSAASFTLVNAALPLPVARNYVYVIKVTCNIPPSVEAGAPAIGLVSGYYSTDINIYNPSLMRMIATITQKFVPAMPIPALAPPALIPPVPVVLAPDNAIRIDCTTIAAAFPAAVGLPLTGFVILYSNVKLNVVAVYTANSVALGGISIDTQYIQYQKYTP